MDEMQLINLTEDGGVRKRIISLGLYEIDYNETPIANIEYIGSIQNGDVFDRNKNFQFKAGAGKVIRGFDIGVLSMMKNERAEILIRSDYGYGGEGSGPIPPNADLSFEIFLIGADPEGENSEDSDERDRERLEELKKDREIVNTRYKSQQEEAERKKELAQQRSLELKQKMANKSKRGKGRKKKR